MSGCWRWYKYEDVQVHAKYMRSGEAAAGVHIRCDGYVGEKPGPLNSPRGSEAVTDEHGNAVMEMPVGGVQYVRFTVLDSELRESLSWLTAPSESIVASLSEPLVLRPRTYRNSHRAVTLTVSSPNEQE